MKPNFRPHKKPFDRSAAGRGPARGVPRTPPSLGTPAREARPAAPGTTHWDNVADWYDRLVGDEGSEYHQRVVLPGVLRMLGMETHNAKRTTQNEAAQAAGATSLRILDLACGQGVLCRQLARHGHQVVGVDAAAGLIEAARSRETTERLGITYAVADATKLGGEEGSGAGDHASALLPGSFDAVTIVLAIQNITPLSPVWQGCRALLKPGGSLIVVMMHPCFRVPRGSDWYWEDATRTQSRVVKQYLTSSKVEIEMQPGAAAAGKGSVKTLTFHRPLQAYINTLGNAGLLLDHIKEWASHKQSQAGPKQAELDRALKEIPLFLALRARKTT